MGACKEYSCSGRKYRSCSQLTILEKINIAFQAIVGEEPYKLISSEHNVKICTIKYLVRKAKKEPDYFKKIQSSRQEYEDRLDLVEQTVKTKLEGGGHLFSSGELGAIIK